jgi:hypothetical protein
MGFQKERNRGGKDWTPVKSSEDGRHLLIGITAQTLMTLSLGVCGYADHC